MNKLKEYKDLAVKSVKDMRDIADRAEKEKRDLTADERKSVADLRTQYDEAKAYIENAEGSAALIKMIGDLEGVGVQAEDKETGKKGRAVSPADEVLSSEAWQSWLKAQLIGGVIPDSRKGLMSPSIPVPGLGRKAAPFTGGDAESAGAFIVPEQTGIFEPLGRAPLALRDLVSGRTTLSDTVEFVVQLTQSQSAEMVPEANVVDYTGATGQVSGTKPYSNWEYQRQSEAVRTVAVWTAATKRALADAGQLRGLINQELREDLAAELEYQMLYGDGTGENLRGIFETPNVLVQPFETDIIVTARKAITRVRTQGLQQPTAFLMNPSDWEAFDLSQDGEQRYVWGGPLAPGRRTLWGLPVVESLFVEPGQAVLANWSKAVLWDRQVSNVTVTDSHSDFFIRNLVAFLAEMRVAFGVIRPSAFCVVELTDES